MIRIIIAVIILLHGLIHLPGFLRAFGLARFDIIQGKTLLTLSSKGVQITGILWLLTCLLLVGAGFLLLFKMESWWIAGLPGLILSQGLIILYWNDAKFGTLINVILLIALILGYSIWQFKNTAEKERQVILENKTDQTSMITSGMLEDLPVAVQKWLKQANVIGNPRVKSVHLHQKGEMRTSKDGKWMPVKAEQYFSVEPPGFLWLADVEAAPFIHLAGKDKYHNGKGHMLIKLMSLIPVANARGETIDQGTLVRYLSEVVWFPSAALSHYITWEEIDANTARATIQNGGITASGIFRFNNQGDFMSFEAQRYFDGKEGATLETWFIKAEENGYKTFEGIRIPAKSSVTWKLEDGDFKWYVLEITDIGYVR